mmetsp:Transcript_94930/g.306461  ORF Transcript_94930/g.306461 Transcript_94930/m.306461 type:complete len:323 (+) Transcript_94930:93-1061(+)
MLVNSELLRVSLLDSAFLLIKLMSRSAAAIAWPHLDVCSLAMVSHTRPDWLPRCLYNAAKRPVGSAWLRVACSRDRSALACACDAAAPARSQAEGRGASLSGIRSLASLRAGPARACRLVGLGLLLRQLLRPAVAVGGVHERDPARGVLDAAPDSLRLCEQHDLQDVGLGANGEPLDAGAALVGAQGQLRRDLDVVVRDDVGAGAVLLQGLLLGLGGPSHGLGRRRHLGRAGRPRGGLPRPRGAALADGPEHVPEQRREVKGVQLPRVDEVGLRDAAGMQVVQDALLRLFGALAIIRLVVVDVCVQLGAHHKVRHPVLAELR